MPRIIDIKCRASLERDWEYQVAFYQSCLGNGVPIQKDERHRYYKEVGDEFTSITRLLTEMRIAVSYAGQVMMVQNAGDRGRVIESAIYEALASGSGRLRVPGSWQEALTTVPKNGKTSWIQGAWNWINDFQPRYHSHLSYVADPEIRVAGEYDLAIEGDGPPAALHINPQFAKGYIFREYPEALEKWAIVRQARLESLAAFQRAREAVLA